MRNSACDKWVELVDDPNFTFLTGDLGFTALEPLRDVLGERFINVGIAEQNMLSVAAGLAIEGMSPWVYSIASFCYARPFEQIRNDVCQHNLPVKIVGNGGGYAYGAMGASHHALEDYGVLLTLPKLQVYVPAFADDLPVVIDLLQKIDHPAYLRLGRSEKPKGVQVAPYSKWRKILCGSGIPIILVGPIAGEYWGQCLLENEEQRPELWVLGELPVGSIEEIPAELISGIVKRGLCVVEEHSCQGGVGQQLSHLILSEGLLPKKFMSFNAVGYPTGRYGSQAFHRHQSGITVGQVLSALERVT